MDEEKRNYCSNKSLEFMVKWAIFDKIQWINRDSIPDYSNLIAGSNTGECFERTKIPENVTPGWLSGRRSYIETKMNLHDSVRYREFRTNISRHIVI